MEGVEEAEWVWGDVNFSEKGGQNGKRNAPLPLIDAENGGVSISASGCEKYMSMLRFGQYGQVGADGFWRNREKVNKKSGDKKVTKKTQMQYDKILAFMEEGKEYRIWDFC